jgi:hypothetical protein
MKMLWRREEVTGNNVKSAFEFIDRLIFLKEEGYTL